MENYIIKVVYFPIYPGTNPGETQGKAEDTNQRKRVEGGNMKKMQSWREDEWTREIYEDIYSQDIRYEDLENDGLADWEEAFMQGWDDAA